MAPYVNKKEVAKEAINKGIAEHKRWIAVAKALAAGIKPDDDFILSPTECTFGQWFYSHGRDFSDLPIYEELEDIHSAIRVLFWIFKKKKKEPAKQGFFQSKKSAESKKNENLNAIIHKMEELVDLFAAKLEEFEDANL